MKCEKCNSEININNITCPICGNVISKQLKPNYFIPKFFLFLFLFMFFSPIILTLIVGGIGVALRTKIININDLIIVIKGIIYIIISIPLFLAILGWLGKIFKNSEKKSIICLVLSIISVVGLVWFNTFCKNAKFQVENYNKQEYITLNNISAPTLYNIVGYDDTFFSLKLKLTEDDIKGEEITIITNEEISDDILYRYKSVLIDEGYSYLGILDQEVEAYIYSENEYYMIIGFLNDDKTIIYLSLDSINYNKFLTSVEIDSDFKNN